MDDKSTAASLVATIRSSIRLHDGYYLSEELVDLYLVGVLRGVAVGLVDGDGPDAQDEGARRKRLDDLTRTSAELLDNLLALRPPRGPGARTPAPGVGAPKLARRRPVPPCPAPADRSTARRELALRGLAPLVSPP
jgi:hypothetical protein